MTLNRTLVCSAPGALALEHAPVPTPGHNEAVVKVRRVGICGTDYHILEGKHPFLEYPRIMGHELAVEVLSPPDKSSFRPGDVCTVNPYFDCGTCRMCRSGRPNCCENISVLGVHRDGGMASYLALPEAKLVQTHGLSADACACVEFLAIGAHAVSRGRPEWGQDVLVVGAGPIGLATAVFARLNGANVTLFDLDADRAERVARIAGVHFASNRNVNSRSTATGGFDQVYDATGNRIAMESGFDEVAPGGTYVLVGVHKETVTFHDPDFHRKEMSLIASRNATSQDFNRVLAAVAAGELDIDRIITHRTTLENAPADLVRWAVEKDGLIKAVIEID